jgi:hypothetical protein
VVSSEQSLAQRYSGRRAEAWEPLGTALRLDPRGPIAATVVHLRAIVSYFERDYAAAEAGARRAIEDHPGVPRLHLTLAAALGQPGCAGEARIALEVAIEAAPGRFKFMTESRPPVHRPRTIITSLMGVVQKVGVPVFSKNRQSRAGKGFRVSSVTLF